MSPQDDRITIEEKFGICEASFVQVCKTMPATMNGHLTKTEWEEFCTKINKDLKKLSIVRSVIVRILLLYIVIMGVLYLCLETFGLFGNYRTMNILAEIVISLGILILILSFYIVYARCSAIGSVRRHCKELTSDVCPRLKLSCHLPFLQFTGGIARGWHINIARKTEIV